MSSFVVVTDSTCDLSPELIESNGLIYAAMNYTIGTDEYPALADWKSHSAKEFYDLMRKGTRVQTTQVPPMVLEEIFREQLTQGKDVLYVACSSALSGSVKTAQTIAENLAGEYPERKVIAFDTLISSLGEGYLALQACAMRDKGSTIDETAAYLESIRLKVNQFGTVDSLEYLKRAGRVTATSAFFGNLIGIKPILISDRRGQNLAVKKVKGAVNVRKEMARMIADVVVDPASQTLYISHADALASAEALRDEVLALVPFKDVFIHYIAPIVGASVGPGTIIAFCTGAEVTQEGEA